jgi:hypothetical protein
MLFNGDWSTLAREFACGDLLGSVFQISTISVESFITFRCEDGSYTESMVGLGSITDNGSDDWSALEFEVESGVVDVMTMGFERRWRAESEGRFVDRGISFFGHLVGEVSISGLDELIGDLLQKVGSTDSVDESLVLFGIFAGAFELSENDWRDDTSVVSFGNNVSSVIFSDQSAVLGEAGNGVLLVGANNFAFSSQENMVSNSINSHGVFDGLSISGGLFLGSVQLEGDINSFLCSFLQQVVFVSFVVNFGVGQDSFVHFESFAELFPVFGLLRDIFEFSKEFPWNNTFESSTGLFTILFLGCISETFMVKGHLIDYETSLGALGLNAQNGLFGCRFRQSIFVFNGRVVILDGLLLSQLEVDSEKVGEMGNDFVNIVVSFMCEPDCNFLGPGQRLGQREKVGVELFHVGG